MQEMLGLTLKKTCMTGHRRLQGKPYTYAVLICLPHSYTNILSILVAPLG